MDAENTAVNEMETTASPKEQQATTQEVKENLLSQDDVNRIVAERVAREKAKFGLGFSLTNRLPKSLLKPGKVKVKDLSITGLQ